MINHKHTPTLRDITFFCFFVSFVFPPFFDFFGRFGRPPELSLSASCAEFREEAARSDQNARKGRNNQKKKKNRKSKKTQKRDITQGRGMIMINQPFILLLTWALTEND